MRKSVIAIAALGIAVAGCAKKKPPATAGETPTTETAADGAAAEPDGGTGVGLDSGVTATDVAASRADFVARAGSDTIYFNTDRFDVDDAGRATLDAQAAWLVANPQMRASVEGHADERGTREYNIALGERRANAAKNHLVARGVPSDRLTVVSWGKERPVSEGSSEESWAQNRRSVTVLPQ